MAEEPANPVIELVNATIARVNEPSSVRLRGVNWSIREGEFWLLGAPASSGKSDVLVTAAGLQRPSEGHSLLHGQDISKLDETELISARRKVGFVFEGGGRLFPHLTVRQNIELPVCYHDDCDSETAHEWGQQLIDAANLKEFSESSPSRLGRSIHQRVALARALALQPEVIFLDDPLSGLDPRQVRWWLDFLAQLSAGSPLTKGRKLTVVLGTSDFRTFSNLSTHIALIRRGVWYPGGPKGDIDPALIDEASFFDEEPAPSTP